MFDMAVKTEMKMGGKTNQNYTSTSEEQTDKMKFGPTSSRSAL